MQAEVSVCWAFFACKNSLKRESRKTLFSSIRFSLKSAQFESPNLTKI